MRLEETNTPTLQGRSLHMHKKTTQAPGNRLSELTHTKRTLRLLQRLMLLSDGKKKKSKKRNRLTD